MQTRGWRKVCLEIKQGQQESINWVFQWQNNKGSLLWVKQQLQNRNTGKYALVKNR